MVKIGTIIGRQGVVEDLEIGDTDGGREIAFVDLLGYEVVESADASKIEGAVRSTIISPIRELVILQIVVGRVVDRLCIPRCVATDAAIGTYP